MALQSEADKKYKIQISYDGTNYAGWQVQKTGLAIAPLIQKALETVLRHPLDLTGSGRTDAGVHALDQVAHFNTSIDFDPHRLLLSINALLPLDIRVYRIENVKQDFHARYSAKSKIYHYHLHLDPISNPFNRLYRYHYKIPCDFDLIKDAIPLFLGTNDYTSFANQPHRGTASYDPIRTINRIDVINQEGGVRLEFEADGFLYKMVRNITGTLLDIGSKKIKTKDISKIFAARDRKKAGMSAPPQALFLTEVKY